MRRTKQTKSSRRKDKAANLVEPQGEIETPKALLNDVVLQNIFKYLGYKDLKSCRDVKNCVWLRNSKKAWWSRTKVTFKESHYLEDRMDDYIEDIEVNCNATNYKFKYCVGIHMGFYNTLGHSIKYLELSDCRLPSVDTFRNLIYTWCPNLEKLVAFRVKFDNFVPPKTIKPLKWHKPQYAVQTKLKMFKFVGVQLPVSWMEFLSHFPNLQGLEAYLDNVDIYKVISTIRQQDSKMLKLDYIDINFSRRSDYVKSLRLVLLDPSLSLETIRIDFGNCTSELVQNFLNLHAKSLKEVCMRGESPTCPREISLSQPLEKLEILDIGFRFCKAGIFKYTPHVRKVVLKNGQDNNDDDDEVTSSLWIADPNQRLHSCKELTLPSLIDWSDSKLEIFLNVFPNVERLETIRLENRAFSKICEKLTKLVSFNVTGYSYVDVVGLLGLDPNRKDKNGIRQPNITNLKDLQSFSMNAGRCSENDSRSLYPRMQLSWNPVTIMEKGGFIFKELQRLHHLKNFELEYYMLKGGRIWEKIFAKYSTSSEEEDASLLITSKNCVLI